MLVERTGTCWPTLRYGVSVHQRAELLEPGHTPTGARVDAVSQQDIPQTDDNASLAQVAPASEQAITPAGREDALVDDQAGADIPYDGPAALRSVAEVLAMGGAMGAIQHAAGVAPPPPGSSAAATAAPQTTTSYTAATSAAQEILHEAQLACGYDDPDSERDGQMEGECADSDGVAADEEDAGAYERAPGNFWMYASVYASVLATAPSGSGGVFARAALQAGGFPLRPAVWAPADYDNVSDDD